LISSLPAKARRLMLTILSVQSDASALTDLVRSRQPCRLCVNRLFADNIEPLKH
jgi:hypothetical protein